MKNNTVIFRIDIMPMSLPIAEFLINFKIPGKVKIAYFNSCIFIALIEDMYLFISSKTLEKYLIIE